MQREDVRAPIIRARGINPELVNGRGGDSRPRGVAIWVVLELEPFGRSVAVIVLLGEPE